MLCSNLRLGRLYYRHHDEQIYSLCQRENVPSLPPASLRLWLDWVIEMSLHTY